MKNCNFKIIYTVNGEEKVGGIIPSDLTSYDQASSRNIMEAISKLDSSSINEILGNLSELRLLSTDITYSNGDPLIGNSNLSDVSTLVNSVNNEGLREQFYDIRNKLNSLGIIPEYIQLLILDGENVSLNVDKVTSSVRGTLLNNNFIVLNTKGTFNENSLKDLMHEMLHIYFNKIPKTGENFARISEIAYNIYKTAKDNQDLDPYIKEFVMKTTSDSGSFNLNEFISYILSEPKYTEVLNLNKSPEFEEFITRLYSLDLNVLLLANPTTLENVQVVEDNTKDLAKEEEVPFVGKHDYHYIEFEIPKSKNISYQQVSETIWDSYESNSLDTSGNPSKDKYSINYSEPVEVESELQLFSLKPGDLLLIPNFSRGNRDIIYGNFDDKYFSYAKYHPVQSVWKNKEGETFITLVSKYGDKVEHFTLSYTDLVKLSLEKRKTLSFRKFYGTLKEDSISPDIIKNIRDSYEAGIESSDLDSQPLIKSLDISSKGTPRRYYTVGKNGFKLDTHEGSNNLINQELRPEDIVKLRTWTKEDENSEWDSFEYYAPVVRTVGTVVEVALKSKEGKYFTKRVPFKDIQTTIFTSKNHPDLTSLYKIYTQNYDEYRESIKDKSLYQSIWVSPSSFLDTDNKVFKGDYSTNIDHKSVTEYRRDLVKKLNIGDSVSVEWSLQGNSGKPIISTHIVVGINNDTIFFLNNRDGKVPSIMGVDIRTTAPIDVVDKGYKRYLPSLSAIHYNNSGDSALINHLSTIKDNINSSFLNHENKLSSEATNEYTSLNDLYDIVNTDESNVEIEASKLQRGDIIKFKEGNISFIGIVSKYDPTTGTIQVPGSYKSGKYEGRTYRKSVSTDQIEYIGFAINPEYNLGILGHKDSSAYREKRLSRLYDLNHSTFDHTLEDILKKKSMLNTNTEWVVEQEAVYVIPKNIKEREFSDKFQDSKKKGLPYGRVLILSPQISKLIKSGDLTNLTKEYIEANGIKSKKLYGLKNIKTGIQIGDNTGYNYDSNILKRSPEQVIDILKVEDIIKVSYGENKYSKYLRIKNITDKGINLQSEIVGLNGKVYNNNLYINFKDILSGKYKVMELLFPINKTRLKELSNLSITSNKVETPQDTYVSKFNKFDKRKILNRVITNINSLYNDIINVVDDAQIEEWVNNKELNRYLADSIKNSGAFILDNKIYINTDKANISSPTHELMHIILGVMRSTSPELYYSLLDKAGTLPDFNERYRKVLSNRTMSDAREEAFADLIADSLSGVLSTSTGDLNNLFKSSGFFDTYLGIIDKSLDLNLGNLDSSTSEVLSREVTNMPIEKIILEFNSLLSKSKDVTFAMFSKSSMDKAFENRKISNIKSELLSSKNLIEKC